MALCSHSLGSITLKPPPCCGLGGPRATSSPDLEAASLPQLGHWAVTSMGPCSQPFKPSLHSHRRDGATSTLKPQPLHPAPGFQFFSPTVPYNLLPLPICLLLGTYYLLIVFQPRHPPISFPVSPAPALCPPWKGLSLCPALWIRDVKDSNGQWSLAPGAWEGQWVWTEGRSSRYVHSLFPAEVTAGS